MKDINISYDSDDLIADVLEDIELFGADYKVYAIYSWFEDYQKEFITDYVDAIKPTRKEFHDGISWDDEDEAEYQQVLKDYEENIKRLHERKYREMTSTELLALLEAQNKLFLK